MLCSGNRIRCFLWYKPSLHKTNENNDPTVITGYHKYLYGYVRSNFSEVPMSDWEKAFSLSLSEFVRVLGGIEVPVNIARYQ